LNGEAYSIADIAHFGWVRSASYVGLELSEYPFANSWVERIEQRENVRRAIERCQA
jgi:GST-like protein